MNHGAGPATAAAGSVQAHVDAGAKAWAAAELAAALVAVDPKGLGGVRLAAPAGELRAQWLAGFEALASGGRAPVVAPSGVSIERLLGGVSAEQSVSAGRVVVERGLLSQAEGRFFVLRMAERVDPQVAAVIAAGMDDAARSTGPGFAAVLLDEGLAGEEAPPRVLTDRLAFRVDLHAAPLAAFQPFRWTADEIETARAHWPNVRVPDAVTGALAGVGPSLGVPALRPALFALAAAKAHAALHGRETVSDEDAAVACRLVFAHHAADAAQPEAESAAQREADGPGASDVDSSDPGDEARSRADTALEDMLIQTVAASIEASVLDTPSRRPRRSARGASGRSGETTFAADRGRPDRPAPGRRAGRLDLLATLRAAAPMQRIRRRGGPSGRLIVRPSDFRMKRFRRRRQSSVIFVVDASGSSAMQRMAEAKGAVERLLADCYKRRDLVSLITFRGDRADIALPPTRSLVRARRRLSELPGGGATPLPRAIAVAQTVADGERQRDRSPLVVFLSDGRGNLTIDGQGDRDRAMEEARRLAAGFKDRPFETVFFDTSKRPDRRAQALAAQLGASYRFLSPSDGNQVSDLVRRRIDRR